MDFNEIYRTYFSDVYKFILNLSREHSFKNYKFVDAEGGEDGALYLVAENTLFDKPDYSQPCYADFSPVVEDDYDIYSYDKIFYGLPDDKDKICIWNDTGEDYLNEASGPIAKYFYDGNFFYQYNKQGDVWKCDVYDITITCYAVFQNWDTSASVNLYEGKLGGFDLAGDVYKEIYVYESLMNQTLSFIDGSVNEWYVEGKYYMEDENTMILTLTKDMYYWSGFNGGGKLGDKLVFHKTQKKGEIGYYGKLNIIDRFGGYPLYYIPEKDIKEFYYKLDDKQLLFATKIEVTTDGLDADGKEIVEQMIKGKELDKFGPSKKYYDIGLDWWNLNYDKVVTSGHLYGGYCGDFMKNTGDYYYVTKENGKYYYYAFCRFDRLSYNEVDKMYKELYDHEFINYDSYVEAKDGYDKSDESEE